MSAAEAFTTQGMFSHKMCDACGMSFYIPTPIERRCANENRGWWCPGCGHSWCYGHTENEKLQQQIETERKRTEWAREEARQQRERAEAEERRARVYKGHATRLRKRVSVGKCPCCSQQFADLATHIAEKHPKYIPHDAETL